jgi:uncharacterized membrane protein YdjX (TVP38/TMEM64 family)
VALLAGSLSGAIVAVYLGPRYLGPQPLWLKLVLAVTGVTVIAVIAIYSRRRTHRA